MNNKVESTADMRKKNLIRVAGKVSKGTQKSGLYRIVQICHAEILAMCEMKYPMVSIRGYIEVAFDKKIDASAFSSNLYTANRSLKDHPEAQQNILKETARFKLSVTDLESSLSTKGRMYRNQKAPSAPLPASSKPSAASASIPIAATPSATVQQAAPAPIVSQVIQDALFKASEDTRAIVENLINKMIQTNRPYREKNIPQVISAINSNVGMYKNLTWIQLYSDSRLKLLINP